MNHAFYFNILKKYSNLWARHNCKVILSGDENINTKRKRIYIVSHPTTWDLPMLAHISKKNFYIAVADDPFAHPLLSWLFSRSGFLRLRKNNSHQVIDETIKVVQERHPMIYSLYGIGIGLGKIVPARTGGIRAAKLAGADICPIHLSLEEGKRILKNYNKSKKQSYPYAVFHNALYFATFLPPIRYENYSKEDMTYEDYKEIAFSLEDSFKESEKLIKESIEINSDYYRNLKRKGGLKKSILL